MKTLASIKKLHGEGWAVHCLKPKSKMPVELGWSKGPRKTWEELRAQFKKGMNLGVRLGQASKLKGGGYLAVIDVDVKGEGEKYLKEVEEKLLTLGVKDTLTVLSGRGGGSRHLYIKTPSPARAQRLFRSTETVKVTMPSAEPSRAECMKLSPEEIDSGVRLRCAWEVSLMGEGQQVVLPGSIHPDTGRAYEWANEGAEVLEYAAPEAILIERETLQDFEAVGVSLLETPISEEMFKLIKSGEGVEDKSAALFSAALALKAAGLNEIEILSVLTDKRYFLGSVGFEHTKSKSRARAAEWVLNYTLKKAGLVLDSRGDFDEVLESGEAVEVSEAVKGETEALVKVSDWREKLERGKDKKPKATYLNAVHILENVVRPGFIKHNEFSLDDIWLEDTPWGSKKNEPIKDIDILRLLDFMAAKYRVEFTKDKLETVLRVIGSKNTFHPVRDYLSGLVWDETPRLDTWLVDYLGVKGPDLYTRTVGRKTLTAMVARIFEPGIAFHHVLILEGKTRHGKSETWKILAGRDWHFDNELDLAKTDSRQSLLGKWVVELAELSTVHQAGVNSVKNFISNDVDRFRLPYGKAHQTYKRQCIFVGTTNNEHYLRDLTGNARYWPVKIYRLKYEELIRDRDQLLAEAVCNYHLGERINFHSKAFYKVAEGEQAKREDGGDIESLIEEVLASDALDFDLNRFRSVDLLKQIGSVPGFRSERALEMKAAQVLKRKGFTKKFGHKGTVSGQWWTKPEG